MDFGYPGGCSSHRINQLNCLECTAIRKQFYEDLEQVINAFEKPIKEELGELEPLEFTGPNAVMDFSEGSEWDRRYGKTAGESSFTQEADRIAMSDRTARIISSVLRVAEFPEEFIYLSSIKGWINQKVYCGPGAYYPKKDVKNASIVDALQNKEDQIRKITDGISMTDYLYGCDDMPECPDPEAHAEGAHDI